MERVSIIVEIEQRIREPIESTTNFAELIGEPFEDVIEIASARGRVRGDELVIRPADLFVKREVRRATQTAALGILVKNPAEKE